MQTKRQEIKQDMEQEEENERKEKRQVTKQKIQRKYMWNAELSPVESLDATCAVVLLIDSKTH